MSKRIIDSIINITNMVKECKDLKLLKEHYDFSYDKLRELSNSLPLLRFMSTPQELFDEIFFVSSSFYLLDVLGEQIKNLSGSTAYQKKTENFKKTFSNIATKNIDIFLDFTSAIYTNPNIHKSNSTIDIFNSFSHIIIFDLLKLNNFFESFFGKLHNSDPKLHNSDPKLHNQSFQMVAILYYLSHITDPDIEALHNNYFEELKGVIDSGLIDDTFIGKCLNDLNSSEQFSIIDYILRNKLLTHEQIKNNYSSLEPFLINLASKDTTDKSLKPYITNNLLPSEIVYQVFGKEKLLDFYINSKSTKSRNLILRILPLDILLQCFLDGSLHMRNLNSIDDIREIKREEIITLITDNKLNISDLKILAKKRIIKVLYS